MNLPAAPSAVDFSPDAMHTLGDYSGPLPNGNDAPIMTGTQIAMSREVFGWPLYAIIIGAGQVRDPIAGCSPILNASL